MLNKRKAVSSTFCATLYVPLYIAQTEEMSHQRGRRVPSSYTVHLMTPRQVKTRTAASFQAQNAALVKEVTSIQEGQGSTSSSAFQSLV